MNKFAMKIWGGMLKGAIPPINKQIQSSDSFSKSMLGG